MIVDYFPIGKGYWYCSTVLQVSIVFYVVLCIFLISICWSITSLNDSRNNRLYTEFKWLLTSAGFLINVDACTII